MLPRLWKADSTPVMPSFLTRFMRQKNPKIGPLKQAISPCDQHLKWQLFKRDFVTVSTFFQRMEFLQSRGKVNLFHLSFLLLGYGPFSFPFYCFLFILPIVILTQICSRACFLIRSHDQLYMKQCWFYKFNKNGNSFL